MNRFNAAKILTTSAKLFLIFLVVACSNQSRTQKQELIIFHAGSLSVPFKQVIKAFNAENPDVTVFTEASGSRDCARKISDLKKECDVMASADYTVIDQLLIPDHADWNIKFASNEMVIGFSEEKEKPWQIDSSNWYKVLLDENTRFGRSEPNADPCGYRTVLTSKLAEKYYGVSGLSEKLLAKDHRFIRPKETDLIALVETNTIDYFFIYRSVAEQHGLNYILLPDAINLKSPEYVNSYAEVTVDLSGKKPGSFITKKGEPMVYGVTIPSNSPNKKNAIKFVDFLLSEKGMKIMQQNGQPSLVPSYSDSYQNIPKELKNYALNK